MSSLKKLIKAFTAGKSAQSSSFLSSGGNLRRGNQGGLVSVITPVPTRIGSTITTDFPLNRHTNFDNLLNNRNHQLIGSGSQFGGLGAGSQFGRLGAGSQFGGLGTRTQFGGLGAGHHIGGLGTGSQFGGLGRGNFGDLGGLNDLSLNNLDSRTMELMIIQRPSILLANPGLIRHNPNMLVKYPELLTYYPHLSQYVNNFNQIGGFNLLNNNRFSSSSLTDNFNLRGDLNFASPIDIHRSSFNRPLLSTISPFATGTINPGRNLRIGPTVTHLN